MDFWLVLASFLYIILGLGFSRAYEKAKALTHRDFYEMQIICMLFWPIGLIAIAFNNDALNPYVENTLKKDASPIDITQTDAYQ